MNAESLNASLVRIHTHEGNVVGAGFLVEKGHVLTCAHVVAQALNLSDIPADLPLDPIVLDFPLLASHPRLAARVVFWCPIKEDGSGDIAGLELLADPPEEVCAVHFTPAEDVWEHAFRVFGFPVGHDEGVWATGRCLGLQANGWLLLEDVKTQGFPIEQGFSGSPVWDTQLQSVLGMVVVANRPAEVKTASIIPFHVLANTWPILQSASKKSIFLSADSRDTHFAERLNTDLRAQGIDVWNALEAPEEQGNGQSQEDFQQAIRNAQAVLIVVSSRTFASRVIRKHVDVAEKYQKRLLLVQVDSDEDRQTQAIGCLDTTWIDAQNYEIALERIEATLNQGRSLKTLFEPVEHEPRQTPRNPYKGLLPFMASDAGDFFGREGLVDELISDVASLLKKSGSESQRCLTVVGPSGSGKSSVVMAGLWPRLQHGALPGSHKWTYLEPMVPGKHPIEALSRVLKPFLPDWSLKALREDLSDATTCKLHWFISQLVKEPEDKVVLFIDQFEELFTLTESEDERQQLIDLLLDATTTCPGSLLVLLTLRADFYDRPMHYLDLSRLMQAHERQVLPMDVEDLRSTIEQPARLPDVRLSFEENLVGDMLCEFSEQVGALPLLQFTLDQLFEKREDHCLTLQAYHSIGGVTGALSQHTEQTYAALPSDEHREMARRLFLRLLEPGASQQDTTRRRAALSEFQLSDPTQTLQMRETIDAFIAARLLTTNEVGGVTTIEVSHEAVIREWKLLAKWLADDREDILFQHTLSENVSQWEQRHQPKDHLYHGSQLKEAYMWARRNQPSEQENAFLQARTARQKLLRISYLVIVCTFISSISIVGVIAYWITHPDYTKVTTPVDNVPGSLRWCVNGADSGSTITFDPSLQGKTITLTGGDLIFAGGKRLILDGSNARGLVITNGPGESSTYANVRIAKGANVSISDLNFENSTTTHDAFIVNKGRLTMTGTTVSGNHAGKLDRFSPAAYGGGIYNDFSGILTMKNNIISGNQGSSYYSSLGGGIYNLGNLQVSNGEILSNTIISKYGESYGGGIYNGGLSEITRTVFNSNITNSNQSTGYGGGIYNNPNGKLIVADSIFTKDEAQSDGGTGQGGGFANNGTTTIMNSTFSENEAFSKQHQSFSAGGGIVNGQGGKLTVINSTLYNNFAHAPDNYGAGGGIGTGGGNASTTLFFSTIADNIADQGGDIAAASGNNNSLTMQGNIVAAKSAQGGSDVLGPLTSSQYDRFQNITNVEGLNPQTDQEGALSDLKLATTLQNNGGFTQTLQLLPGSSAYDAISDSACITIITDAFGRKKTISTDQRGLLRLDASKKCNIGAY